MSFFIDNSGQEDNNTTVLKLPSTKRLTNTDDECITDVEPPSFVKNILENIEKLKSGEFQEAIKPQPKKTRNKKDLALETELNNLRQTTTKGKKKKRRMIELKDVDKVDEVMKKSVIQPGFERLHRISNFNVSDKKLKEQRKREREKTKGKKWYGLPATEITEEVKHDLEVLQMRSVLDPKHFYKKNDLKVLPKYFQVGKVMDSPLDYYNNRCTRKERKRTLVDELLADAEFNKYNKRRYANIIEEKQKTHYKAYKEARKLKRKNKK